MQTRPRIKICCIKSPAEADMAIICGASALGLVSAMPSGPGIISENMIVKITATVPPPIATFLLTSEESPDAIIAQQRRCRTSHQPSQHVNRRGRRGLDIPCRTCCVPPQTKHTVRPHLEECPGTARLAIGMVDGEAVPG